MGNIAIAVEQLGKRYRIGHAAKRPETLRQAIRSSLGAPFHYLRTRLRPPSEDELIWALKDVSFEVKHGEVLGIIGRNGAGKSTLLKILSRITEPTTGQAKVYGRIGSLLEVGTGFHPELTGRENIYLNGAILGMRRQEIDRKFDEIVDFSGVEKFLDTPVKRYSSGMRVRLAFAVAAYLEPEILLIDEVLAVGDVTFQQKCLGKMGEIAEQEGRTVLFVSHNMGAVQHLCHRLLLMQKGKIQHQGDPSSVINSYFSLLHTENYDKTSIANLPRHAELGEDVRFLACCLLDKDGNITSQYQEGDKIVVHLELGACKNDYNDLYVNIGINTVHQFRILTATSRDKHGYFRCRKNGKVSICVSFQKLLLASGNGYTLSITAGRRGMPLDMLEFVVPFDVLDNSAQQVIYHPKLWGVLKDNAFWEVVSP